MAEMGIEEWERWEMDAAEALGCRRVVASGATNLYKGDLKDGTVIVDCKYTEGHSYRLTAAFWSKMLEWGRNECRVPVVAVRADGDGRSELAVVPEWFYCELRGGGGPVGEAPKSSRTVAVGPRLLGGRDSALRDMGSGRVVVMGFADFARGLRAYEDRQ